MLNRSICFAVAGFALAGCNSSSSGPEPLSINEPPALSAVSDKQTEANGPSDAYIVSVIDESPATVTLAATSSNEALIPVAGIRFEGVAAGRTVTVTPQPDLTGTADIALTATDRAGLSATRIFTVTVVPKEVSLQVFTRSRFEQDADGDPALINAVEFNEDTQSEDFADLFD